MPNLTFETAGGGGGGGGVAATRLRQYSEFQVWVISKARNASLLVLIAWEYHGPAQGPA